MTDIAVGAAPVRSTLARWAAALGRLTGWRRAAVAFACGGLATLAMPPVGAAPLLLIALPALIWLLDGTRTWRGAFAVGWSFGFGFMVVGLYWVTVALFVDIASYFWLVPFSVTGLPALLAVFPGLAAAAWRRLNLSGVARVLAFAALFGAAEWLRGHVLTGFPWNLLGYTWVDWTAMLQSVALFGAYGLTLVTVLVAALPAALADRNPRPAQIALAAGLLLFAALAGWGALRLGAATEPPVPGVTLRLVQPNIQQRDKWDPELRMANLERLIALSRSPGAVTHVIWPETAVPFLLDDDPALRQLVADAVPPGGLLLTGVPRLTGQGDAAEFWNSFEVLDGTGQIRATYDKFHLVPFGEYMPLRDWLPIDQIAPGLAPFSSGPGPRTLVVEGLPPFSPLICYEGIFPGAVTAAEGERPAWLVNVTNDAWYGITAGPHQHFAIAQTRAVEEGLPLVRVAMTGVSGVVDAHGRVTAQLGLGVQGVVDAALPAALPPTLYARWGDLPFWLLAAAALLAALILSRGRTKPLRSEG